MKIKLRLFGELKAVAGCREIVMSIPEKTSLGQVLCLLEAKLRTTETGLFDGDGLSNRFRVLINGRDTYTLQGIDTLFADGDTVAIFPHIVGG